ncbi:hypothetical protein A7K99_11985 [Tatumella citrea]|uniref:Uncharacterized protein n=1 Tax=Tatumella citrea TaxID=53336 RepID=A0A1Y0LK39_TATCI|nr:hypothetical protein A7K98_11990 [Tatumella citrea]ARU98464.1 hypothetical protein A7K99_11985 [Tatumella citrea]
MILLQDSAMLAQYTFQTIDEKNGPATGLTFSLILGSKLSQGNIICAYLYIINELLWIYLL